MSVVTFPATATNSKSNSNETPNHQQTAIVYCEENFGRIDGKTANGLVRSSEKYKIIAVIDSTKAGQDSGMALEGTPNGIPICGNIAEALEIAGSLPDSFIYGMAPLSGMLSDNERSILLEAINLGMNIVNGLHQFLNDDPEFAAASIANNVTIVDVRKPPEEKDLKIFSGRISEVACPRIAVLGTDCAIGKRTTATILTKALNDHGIKAVMVGTGQTGLIQGARHGIAMDAIPPQFCAGEMEAAVLAAFEQENPDVIIIEGQSSVSHPAFSSSVSILKGSCPNAVILQHAPGRINRCDFDAMPMPSATREITLIETLSDTKVIGLTINHENMTDKEVSAAITHYEDMLDIPATNALTRSPDHLVQMVLSAFPALDKKTLLAAE